jgi:hypothetical protein
MGVNNVPSAAMAASNVASRAQNKGSVEFNEEELNQIGNQILSVLQGFTEPESGEAGGQEGQPSLGQTIRASIYGGSAMMNPVGKSYFKRTKADDAEYWSSLGYDELG